MRIIITGGTGLIGRALAAVPRHLQDLGFTFRFPKAESALRDLL